MKHTGIVTAGRNILLFILVFNLVVAPSAVMAAPNVPGFYGDTSKLATPALNALPVVRKIVKGAVIDPAKQKANRRLVEQTQEKAVIEWDSFDIGAEAWTHFDQKGNTDWAALNRIYDKNPSQIFGKLTADGKIYLINQNGILFGKGSQVNTHGLVASALHIRSEDFLNDILAFKAGDYDGENDTIESSSVGEAVVANYGTITAADGETVMLIAPQVENNGTIEAPNGYVGLVAGQRADVTTEEASGTFRKVVAVGEPGPVTNFEAGRITADYGQASLYGSIVKQEGVIRSVSAVNREGRIELLASEKVVTGKNSITGTPVSTDTEAYHESFDFNGGEIILGGSVDAEGTVSATETIVHNGTLYAPSGSITLSADRRVQLEDDSLIDVSGNWVLMDTADGLASLQLNSVELKNDPGQQDGNLQNETVIFSRLMGSAIGDVSGTLSSDEVTSLEMSTTGGDILIEAPNGEIVVTSGARIDFSGGGYHYTEGAADSTKLLAGRRVYDISSAPEWLQYDAILGINQTIYSRYGIVETLSGLYCGGAAPVSQYRGDFIEGHDAGTLKLVGKTVVLNGTLTGWATSGIYQTEYTESEQEYGEYTYLTSSGRKRPRGGTLIVGEDTPEVQASSNDYVVDEVVIGRDAAFLPENFDADASLADVTDADGTHVYISSYSDAGGSLTRSYLSAESISNAGLSDFQIYTNTKVTVDAGAALKLAPGGLRVNADVDYSEGQAMEYLDTAPSLFYVAARAVEFNGSLRNPAGETIFDIVETITSAGNTENPTERIVGMQNRTYLGAGSRIDLSGEQIDNSVINTGLPEMHGHIDAGSLVINDQTSGGSDVIVMSGAVIDVSSGYEIGRDGGVVTGDAGSIAVQGSSIVLDGTVMGYSLPGSAGGSITLHASAVSVTQKTPQALPNNFTFDSDLGDFPLSTDSGSVDRTNLLVFGQDQLIDSGFTDLTINSYAGIDLENGMELGISPTKLSLPTVGLGLNAYRYGIQDYDDSKVTAVRTIGGREVFDVSPGLVGDSHIGLNTAMPENDSQILPDTYQKGSFAVYLPGDASISVAPGGSISLKGVDLALGGTLEAPGGSVSLTSSYFDLTLEKGSSILAGGINLPVPGEYAIQKLGQEYTVLSGGDVYLSAKYGNVDIEPGAHIDISGSEAVTHLQSSIQGYLSSYDSAESAGSLSLVYRDTLSFEGRIDAASRLTAVSGGTLLVNKISGNAFLEITPEDIDTFVRSGFDALTYKSPKGIVFSDSMDIHVARALTLDAPLIHSTGGQDILLSAPWLSVGNSNASYAALVTDSTALSASDSRITLAGDWLDVFGSLAFSGFETVTLRSANDIRLSDQAYTNADATKVAWQGKLRTAGDLNLQAARIYPQTYCDFTLRSDNGTLTILPGGSSENTSVVSAGGTLALEADHIVQKGVLAAPAGQIAMGREVTTETDADGNRNLVVAEPATTVVLAKGSYTSTACGVPVVYGESNSESWRVTDKPLVLSSETDFDNLAVIDTAPISGVTIDADDVRISDGAVMDLSAGGSIFSYVFMPGVQGTVDPLASSNRYVIVPGISLPGPSITITSGGTIPAGTYSILPSSYAFLPGAYILEKSGASVTVNGGVRKTEAGFSTITGYETLTGGFKSSARLYSYTLMPASQALSQGQFQITEISNGVPGTLSLSATDTMVLEGSVRMQALSGFSGGDIAIDAVNIIVGANLKPPAENWTGLLLDPALFKGLDIDTLSIGDAEDTQSLTLSGDVTLSAATISLAANGDVELESCAQIHGVDTTPSLDNLKIQYTYDPQYGLNGFQVSNLTGDTDTGIWSGTITHKYAEDGVSFIADDDTMLLLNGDQSSLPIEEASGIIVSPYGRTLLTSTHGDIVINDKSAIHASDEVGFDGQIQFLGGVFYSDHSKLTLSGDGIYFVPEAFTGARTQGLYLTENIWRNVLGFDDVYLKSRSDLVFLGDFVLPAGENLTIDAARIVSLEPQDYAAQIPGFDGTSEVTISAGNVSLLNTGSAYTGQSNVSFLSSSGQEMTYVPEDTGIFRLEAAETLSIGKGELLFDGYQTIRLTAAGDVTLKGDGGLASDWEAGSGGSLVVQGARLTTSYYCETDGSYAPADFTLNAGSGLIQVLPGTGSSNGEIVAGGSLTLAAGRIENYGIIDNFAGTVNLHTSGDGEGGIMLASGSAILARGGVVGMNLAGETELAFFGGGTVNLQADNGSIQVNQGALVDVSNSRYVHIDAHGDAQEQDLATLLGALEADELFAMIANGELTARQFSGGVVNVSAPVNGVRLGGELLAGDNGGLSLSGWRAAFFANSAEADESTSKEDLSALLDGYLHNFEYRIVDDVLQVKGAGGSLSIYTDTVDALYNDALYGDTKDDFIRLNELLKAGGFTENVILATAGTGTDNGDIDISGNTIEAHYLKLIAERGSVNLKNVQINLNSSRGGGTLELLAQKDITVMSDGAQPMSIDAVSTSDYTGGGLIYMGSKEGTISVSNATMDVSGNGSIVDGGHIVFRAGIDTTLPQGMRLDIADTQITGAEQVSARAFDVLVYDDGQTDAASVNTAAEAIMENAANNEQSLLSGLTLVGETENGEWGPLTDQQKEAVFHYVPDVEIVADGDLTIDSAWDLSSMRYGGQNEAGYLTLRAAGDLHIKKDITDTPTLNSSGYDTSWAVNLVAGADLQNADLMATGSGDGKLFVGDYYYDNSLAEWQLTKSGTRYLNARVYTEFGDLQFASAGNTYIGGEYIGYFLVNADDAYSYNSFRMGFNLGTYSGDITGYVGQDLVFKKSDGGAIQSAIGNIGITIDGDLYGFYPGESAGIRTTGKVPVRTTEEYYEFSGIPIIFSDNKLDFAAASGGGDISITTGGSIYSYQSNGIEVGIIGIDSSQSEPTNWAAFVQPILVDETIEVNADNPSNYTLGDSQYAAVYKSTEGTTGGIVTMGGGDIRIDTGGSFNSRAGTFKDGDLTIFAQDDVSGHFLVADGIGSIISMADVVSKGDYDLSIELLNASAGLFAMGSAELGTAFNPSIAFGQTTSLDWNLTYSPASALNVQTGFGDVTLSGLFVDSWAVSTYRLLPPVVEIISSGDITLESNFVIAPSEYGELRLISGGTISGAYSDGSGSGNLAEVRMTDIAPEDVFGRHDGMSMTQLSATHLDPENHASVLIHSEDPDPVEIKAAADIEELRIITNKKSNIYAGGDITGLYYFGQNLHEDDLSYIIAGGDISLDSVIRPMNSVTDQRIINTGLLSSGPGDFLVQAGGSIYLGTTQGIQTVGNLFNTALTDAGSNMYVLSGISSQFSSIAIDRFFEGIKDAAETYSLLLSQGEAEQADRVIQETRESLINPILGGVSGNAGDIFMTNAQISSESEAGNLYMLASGDINVGLTTIPDPEAASGQAKNTGIYTSRGGAIYFFASGDVNVNESRVMTFRGGDIVGWSDYGSINAGRGSKTAVNVNPPRVVWEDKDRDGIRDADELSIEWQPPAVGSGIRAVTYDPDGVHGPRTAPPAGDIYLAAPAGIIDAGEAGIAGNNILLAAKEIVNAQNIEVAGTSVGVPDASANSAGLGALVGGGGLNDAAQMAGDNSTLGDAKERFSQYVSQFGENLVPRWLAVEVVGFGADEDDNEE